MKNIQYLAAYLSKKAAYGVKPPTPWKQGDPIPADARYVQDIHRSVKRPGMWDATSQWLTHNTGFDMGTFYDKFPLTGWTNSVGWTKPTVTIDPRTGENHRADNPGVAAYKQNLKNAYKNKIRGEGFNDLFTATDRAARVENGTRWLQQHPEAALEGGAKPPGFFDRRIDARALPEEAIDTLRAKRKTVKAGKDAITQWLAKNWGLLAAGGVGIGGLGLLGSMLLGGGGSPASTAQQPLNITIKNGEPETPEWAQSSNWRGDGYRNPNRAY